MKVSGFSILRNGVQFDYPFLQSYRSLLPLVDEFVINVGDGTDSTRSELEKWAKAEGLGKVVLFDSTWPLNDPEKKRGGQILAEQTNLALNRCTGDWCAYLQADEVLHEKDHQSLRDMMKRYHRDPKVEGLLFDYTHFYGSYSVVQETRSAYRREVRIVKRSANPKSVGDAQSFRKDSGEKLRVVSCGARVYHYGWVRTPDAMKDKTTFMDQLYHGSHASVNGAASDSLAPHTGTNYLYKRFWGLKRFQGTHPKWMHARIEEKNWNWDFENSPYVWTWRDAKKVFLDLIEKWTGIRFFEYRSYKKMNG